MDNGVMTPALTRYITRAFDRSVKVPKDALVNRLRRLDPVFMYFDTETTGLKDHKDQIHELAMIATSEGMNEIARMHLKMELGERSPDVLKRNGLEKISTALDFMTSVQMDSMCEDLKRRCELTMDEKAKPDETAYYQIIYNEFTKLLKEYKIKDNSKVRTLYWGLFNLVESFKMQNILNLTEFNKNDAMRFSKEEDIGRSYRDFIDKVQEATKSKNPIMVAQNYGFDQGMIFQATRKAKVRFKVFKFIDTVYLSKKFVSRYLLCTFKYFYEKWLANPDPRIAKVLVKLKPMPRNKLGIVTEFFGIPNPQWHTALNDALVLQDLLKIQLGIDLRFRTVSERKKRLAEIEKEYITEWNLTKAGTPRDFLHGPNDPYRKEHTKIYVEFLGRIGQDTKDHFTDVFTYDTKRDMEYLKRIREEFPQLGMEGEYKPDKFKLQTNWKKYHVFASAV